MTPSSNSDPSYEVNLYKCPHCGALKVLRTSYNGYVNEVVYWSDSKNNDPKIITPSFVQRCPACKKYYFRDEETLYETDIHITCDVVWGRLSYHSLREAFKQLSPKGREERQIRLMLLHAHNDLYGGCEGSKPRYKASADEQHFFKENAEAIASMGNISNPYDRIFTAELYREIGQFDNAIKILQSPFDIRLYLGLEAIRTKILEKSQREDSNVFIIEGDNNHLRQATKADDIDYLYDDDFKNRFLDKDYLPF